ncbi:MAG: hypothetical protein EXR65_01975 [Dehalococcoidia bacterium]|nr:hypothetical protein [Dehalococcoidia bacterium]
MASETSVVTPGRFASGLDSYPAWLDAILERKAEFQKHYDEYVPQAADIAAVKALVKQHGVKVLVIGEHWCPDVWRGLPVIAKIAEATGMEMRILFRDQNKDVMAEFLNQGQFESIPVFVFYDRNHRCLGPWIERPKLATEQMAAVRKRVMPNGAPAEGPERDALMLQYREETNQLAGEWRHATLTEIRELLEQKLK